MKSPPYFFNILFLYPRNLPVKRGNLRVQSDINKLYGGEFFYITNENSLSKKEIPYKTLNVLYGILENLLFYLKYFNVIYN